MVLQYSEFTSYLDEAQQAIQGSVLKAFLIGHYAYGFINLFDV